MLDLFNSAPSLNILKLFQTANSKLSSFLRISCSISGGADSDIMLDAFEKVRNKELNNI